MVDQKCFGKRQSEGAYNSLMIDSPTELIQFVRMTATDFKCLLKLNGPVIIVKSNEYRALISAGELLASTLCFL